MNQVFADTSFWLALLSPRVELHAKALMLDQLWGTGRIVTSEMVLAEVLNGFSSRGSQLRMAVAKAVESLRGRTNVEIVPQSSVQFERALRHYREMADKSWSLTDCASFQIMEAMGIREALTYDNHFI